MPNGEQLRKITDPRVHLPTNVRAAVAADPSIMEVGELPDDLPPHPGDPASQASPTPSYYNKVYQGVTLDPARIARVYGVTDPMLFTVLKKVLRHGNGQHKDAEHDLREAHDALNRYFEMQEEDQA